MGKADDDSTYDDNPSSEEELGNDKEAEQYRMYAKSLRQLGINNIREQDLEISSQKVAWIQWVMLLVLFGRVGLNVLTIILNFIDRPARNPNARQNLSTLAQTFAELCIEGCLVVIFIVYLFYFIIARHRPGSPALRKALIGDAMRGVAYWLKWVASFSLLHFIPSVGAIAALPDEIKNALRRINACFGLAEAKDDKPPPDSLGIKAIKLFVIIIFVVIQLLLFCLGTVAFYVKVAQLSPLFFENPQQWQYQDYIAFFGFMNNIASLQDIPTVTSDAVLTMIFGGPDGKVSQLEWRNQQTFVTNVAAVLVLTKGFWRALALLTVFSSVEMQTVLIKEKSLKQHKDAAAAIADAGLVLPPPDPVQINTRPGDVPPLGASEEAAHEEQEQQAAAEALQRQRDADSARKQELVTLSKTIAQYTDEQIEDDNDTTARTNVIRYNFLRADTDNSGRITKDEAHALFQKAAVDDRFDETYDQYDPNQLGYLDGPSFGLFMTALIHGGFDWHVDPDEHSMGSTAAAATISDVDSDVPTDDGSV